MPAIGVTSAFQALVTPGSGTVISEVTQDASREVKTVKNASGVTVQAGVLPMTETKISVKGKGAPALTLAVAGTAGVGVTITTGTVAITSVSVDESNEDYPDFSIEASRWS
jgi:hypothetical protein